nr:pol polyprotein - Chinese hamster intracisternal A-particle CHIAP34 [Chinese hamster Intracisternal A-particle CHIAP34]
KRTGFYLGAIEASRPIPWNTEDPVWVSQWPLSSEKLEVVTRLIQEQEQLGHLESSTSPWNSPIFIIKKKSGKWRLLHDLRAINNQMRPLGPVQRGLPLLSALPQNWKLIIIDIKDCFFSIPLFPRDRQRFAFTVPSLNHMEPDKRYQWRVLPQGMANSPTICQLYVQKALEPVRKQFTSMIMIHYMDDILICHRKIEVLQQAFPMLVAELKQWGLEIASEKVQVSDTGLFLGSVITPTKIIPQKIEIRKDHLRTLNDFQKLLGDINWLRPFLKIPSADLKPLFDILEGEPHISSPRSFTPAACQALQKVEKALQDAQLHRIDETLPFSLCVFKTAKLPTAILWQHGPLLWIHPNASPAKIIDWYPDAVVQLALRGIKAAVAHFGRDPHLLVVPYTTAQIQTLTATSNDWAVLVTSFSGKIDNHFPKHPILQFTQNQAIVFPQMTAKHPIPNGTVVYTDGSKTGVGAYVIGNKVVSKQFNETSPQIVECQVVLEVLEAFPGPLNIVSDSSYVVNAVNLLETAGIIRPSSRVAGIFQKIQITLSNRRFPVFVTHVRAHSGLPGPMSSGNDLADRATKLMAAALSTQIQAAQEFHQRFHVTAETLRRQFALTKQEARQIVTQCKNCCEFLPAPHVGINPHGIRPLQMWQMDVTHVASFGKLQYVHVSVDTCSGIICATPLTGEKAAHVIQHCLEAWGAWGKPHILKTDNGPAYTSQKFQHFCRQMEITHLTGLPYNPQGQGIVECAHRIAHLSLI